MDQIQFNLKMYNMLERDFCLILDYVPIESYRLNKHWKVWSPKCIYIILNGCSEIETVIKQILEHPNSNSIPNISRIRRKIADGKTLRIDEYAKELDRLYKLSKYRVNVIDINLNINPFSSFKENKAPPWWKDYNALKHNRSGNYLKGNLKKALYVIVGLYLINWIHPDDIDQLFRSEISKIFRIK